MLKTITTPTCRDPQLYQTHVAIAWIGAAKDAQNRLQHGADIALQAFGDHGPLIAGCVRDHFPEPIKDHLRLLATHRTTAIDCACRSWREAGRRAPIRTYLEAAGVQCWYRYINLSLRS